MLDSIRFELEPRGIKVSVVNPGFVKTPSPIATASRCRSSCRSKPAVKALVKGLEQERREIHFPKVFTWTLKFLRVLPYPVYQWIMRRATRGRQLAKEAALHE